MSKRRPAVSSHHHLLSFSRKHPRRSICARLKVLFRSSEVLLSFSQPAHFQSFCNPARAHSSPDPAHGKMKNLWRDFFFLVQVQKSLSKVDVETFQEAWSGIWTEPVQGKGKAKAAGGRGSLPERLPSQHWMEDINHALLSVNRRLRDFALESQGEGVLTRPPLQCPRTLVLCTDQESKQLASAYYLQFHKDAFVFHVPDPGHRGWNDTWLALAQAGMSKDAMRNLALYNIKYGPWSKSGFFKKVQDAAKLLSEELQPNDPLLQFFYPQILADLGRCADKNDEASRKEFLGSLPSLPVVTCKGPKASSSRFHSLVHAHDFLDDPKILHR